MRILIVTQYFWPEAFRINDLAISLKDRGHEVAVFTGMPNYPEGSFFKGYGLNGPYKEDYKGITVYRAPLIPRGKGSNLRQAINYASFAVLSLIRSSFLDFEKFDIIFVAQLSPITVGLPAIYIKQLYKIPIVFWIQDLWPESLLATGAVTSQNILRMASYFVRWMYSHCDKILYTSRGFLTQICEHGVEPTRLEYFPQWPEDYYKPLHRSEYQLPQRDSQDDFRILFAGNIGVAQSFETILAAAERLKDERNIKWHIYGEGRNRFWVEEQIKARGLNNIFLLGRKGGEEMPKHFAQADVLLLTLMKKEIFSLTVPAKLQSYIACGKPVLAAIDGEGRSIIEQANAGFCAPAEDGRRLAELAYKMSKMDKSELYELGNNGYQYCKAHFNKAKLIKQLENLMAELIA